MANDWGGILQSALRNVGQGFMYGAASYNPQILPQVMHNDPNVQQPAWQEQRKQQLAEMILKSAQAGTIGWDKAGPALQKLGYPTKGMDLGMEDQTQALQQYGTGLADTMGGQPAGGLTGQGLRSAPAPQPAVQPQPATPESGVQTQPLAPPPGSGQPLPTQSPNQPPDVVLSEQKDEHGRVVGRTIKAADSNQTYSIDVDPASGSNIGIKTSMGGESIAGLTPEENAAMRGDQQTLSKPPVTYEQLYRNLAKAGVKLTPKNRLAAEAHFKDLVKEDQDKRAAAMDAVKTRLEIAKQRASDPAKQDYDEAVSINAKGETIYQSKRWNREKRMWEDVGIPHPKGTGVTVNLSPGEQEEQKLSAKQVIEKDSIALEGNASLDSQIATAKMLNKDMIGGTFAAERMAVNTLFSGMGFLSKEQESTLSNSRQYGKLLNQFVISYINEKLFPQRVTNVDLQFLSKVTPEQGYSQEARDAILDMMKHYNDQHSRVIQGRIDWYGEHGTIRGYKPPKLEPFFKPGPKQAGEVPVSPKGMTWDELNGKP